MRRTFVHSVQADGTVIGDLEGVAAGVSLDDATAPRIVVAL